MTTFTAVARKQQTGFQVEAQSRRFTIHMDEPREFGGQDTGISPGELLLAALGGCMCMVLTALSRQHRIVIRDMWIEVEGDMNLLGYLNGTGEPRSGFQQIRYRIHVDTPASPAAFRQFHDAVKHRCPAGDTLLNGTPVVMADIVQAGSNAGVTAKSIGAIK